MISDEMGRSFDSLRLSLLNRCNFACTYCTGTDHMESDHEHQEGHHLPPHQILELVARLHQLLSLRSIRLTGGEPLLYHDLEQVIAGLTAIHIPEITLTTNGWLLERRLPILVKNRIGRINVSLDAIDEAIFLRMTRRAGVDRIMRGIERALDAGIAIRINMVVMRNINDTQIIPMLQWAHERGIIVRFLEVMNMGPLHGQYRQWFYSQHEMLEQVASTQPIRPWPRKAGSTARYWETAAGQKFGIIANESAPFCSDCGRLRLDSAGRLYGCLSNEEAIEISTGDSHEQLQRKLREALSKKQRVAFTGSSLSMMKVGG